MSGVAGANRRVGVESGSSRFALAGDAYALKRHLPPEATTPNTAALSELRRYVGGQEGISLSLMCEEPPHFLEKARKRGLIFKDQVISAR